MKSRKSKRSGFTLVELLTVMVIISILAGMTVGAVTFAIAFINRAAISTEIKNMESALQNYKNKFGEYPPDNQAAVASHMRRCHRNSNQANDPTGVNPQTALVIFLSPRCADPTKPFDASRFTSNTVELTEGCMDFDKSRLDTANKTYSPRNSTVPYVYFRCEYDNGRGTYANKTVTNGAAPYFNDKNGTTDWYGDKTYQIMSAGLDNQFTGGDDVKNPNGIKRGDGSLKKNDLDNIVSFAPTSIKDLLE